MWHYFLYKSKIKGKKVKGNYVAWCPILNPKFLPYTHMYNFFNVNFFLEYLTVIYKICGYIRQSICFIYLNIRYDISLNELTDL